MMIVLVDDLRSFRKEVADQTSSQIVVIRNSQEALVWLCSFMKIQPGEKVLVDQLWLDHDLGMVPNREYDPDKPGSREYVEDDIIPFVKRLVELAEEGMPFPVGQIIVHTANTTVGRKDIVSRLKPWYPNTVAVDAGAYLEY